DGIPRRSHAHVKVALMLTVAGTASFLVSIVASTYLVASVRLGSTAGGVTLALIAALAGWSWFYLPLVTFKKWPDRTTGAGPADG
ncbi:MAG TPA: hypothetical protein VLB67_05560, partial [Acidimicrobiia bacterium]|nr:hypothetical protein [Acidimicrobiia bacterium]